MTKHSQPADLRVNRGNILRRIGRVCWPDGGRPGLPAPASVTFRPSLSLGFDTLSEVTEWVSRYDLHAKSWTDADGRTYTRAEGVWEGIDLEVYGSRLDPPPADTDPDDLGDVARVSPGALNAALAVGGDLADVLSVEDVAPRGTDAAEDHDPAVAKTEHDGYGHERGRAWNASTGEQPAVAASEVQR